jgi:hypothetical protein
MEDIKSYGTVGWKDWYLLYELEYKMSQFSQKAQRGQLTDSEYIYYNKLKEKLREVANRLLPAYYDAFDSYIDWHVSDEIYNSLRDSDIIRIFGESFFNVFDDLREAYHSEDLNYKIQALNQAKDYTHSYYQHIVTLIGEPEEDLDVDVELARYRWDDDLPVWDDDSVEKFYDDLSGGRFIPEWDKEVERMASNFNWYIIAQNYTSDISMKQIEKRDPTVVIPIFLFPTLMSFLNNDWEYIKKELSKYETGDWVLNYDPVEMWSGFLYVCNFVLSDAIEQYNFSPEQLREMRVKAAELKSHLESLPQIQNVVKERQKLEKQEDEQYKAEQEKIRIFHKLLQQLHGFEDATIRDTTRIFGYSPQEKSKLREDIQRALMQVGSDIKAGHILDEASELMVFLEKLQRVNFNQLGTEDINKLSNWYYFLKLAQENPPSDATGGILNQVEGWLIEIREKITEVLLEYQDDQKILDYLYNRINPNIRDDFFNKE